MTRDVALLQEKQTKLWHTTYYDNEVKLKQLYVKICYKLPAHGCKLFDVKEVLSGGGNTSKKVERVRLCCSENLQLVRRMEMLCRVHVCMIGIHTQYMHAYIPYIHICRHTHTCSHTFIHAHTLACTHACQHAHTHIKQCSYLFLLCFLSLSLSLSRSLSLSFARSLSLFRSLALSVPFSYFLFFPLSLASIFNKKLINRIIIIIIIIIIIRGQFIKRRKWWFGPHHIKGV